METKVSSPLSALAIVAVRGGVPRMVKKPDLIQNTEQLSAWFRRRPALRGDSRVM